MAKSPPGSFSKNFAWHGTGLRRLHSSIRAGFSSRLAPVQRNRWRANSGIADSALDLIPVNFFLHNRAGQITVDELVYQAVSNPHSLRFDRLGLFALHLNRVGSPPFRGPSRPAMWANEFVRQRLWQSGSWVSAELHDGPLDLFIDNTMAATRGVRLKSRNNYRHLFKLCGYWPTRLPVINSGADDWAEQGLFLSWDRLLSERGPQTEAQLINWANQEELYKLMGESQAKIQSLASNLAPQYLSAGGLSRFTAPPVTPAATTSPILPSVPSSGSTSARATRPGSSGRSSAPALLPAELLNESGSNDAVSRKIVQTSTQVRDRRLAATVRLVYGHECMICGCKLQVGDGLYYSEAAHIKPLGAPHHGPDKSANIIVLCPNHHLQFDYGVVRLQRDSSGNLNVCSKISGDPLNGRTVAAKHALDDNCIRWHFDWFDDKNR